MCRLAAVDPSADDAVQREHVARHPDAAQHGGTAHGAARARFFHHTYDNVRRDRILTVHRLLGKLL